MAAMPKRETTKKSLGAFLKEHGFQGSTPTFRRFIGKDFVALVNLQASSGKVYVNLGAHYRWLGKPSSWEKTKEYECAFRTRLADFAANKLFSLRDEASVTAMLEMMKLEGLRFFEQLEPDQIAKTAKALARDGYESFAPLDTPADAATWSKVAAHLGDIRSKKRFDAQYVAAERARDEELARERAEGVEMTYAEAPAANKAGPMAKIAKNPKSAAKGKTFAKRKSKRTRRGA